LTKKASIFFIFMLVFQSIAGGLGMPARANAEEATGDIFIDMTWTDEIGNTIQLDELDDGERVLSHIGWSAEGEEIDTEETYRTQLPDAVNIKDQTGEISTGDHVVGTYHASEAGDISVQFSKEIADFPDANGTLTVEGVYVDDQVDADEENNDATSENEPDGNKENNNSGTDESEENADEEVDDTEDTDEEKSEENADEENDSGETNENDSGEMNENEANDNDDDAAVEEKSKNADGEKERQSNAVLADEDEKSGFKLELDEITDLEGNAYDEQNPLDPHEEFHLSLNWELENSHNYVGSVI